MMPAWRLAIFWEHVFAAGAITTLTATPLLPISAASFVKWL